MGDFESMGTGMFDNYPQPDGYVPDNRGGDCCVDCHCEDVVVVGGTAIHTFKLDFLFSDNCESFDAVYSIGVGKSFSVDSSSLGAPYSIEEKDGKTYITVTLDPSITAEFDEFRDAYAQLKLRMKDGSVIFGDKNRLTVKGTLSGAADESADDTTFVEASMEDLVKII